MEEYLTVKDIKNILKISQGTAYNLVNRNDFPKTRIGNTIRIPKSQFIKYMNRYLYKTI